MTRYFAERKTTLGDVTMFENEENGQFDCKCRCGFCCSFFRIEVSDHDAGCDPKVRRRATPITKNEANGTVTRWLLNSAEGPCVFFSRDAQGLGVCEIYETRPEVCRMFDCDHASPGL